ncbi:methyltransferase [Vitiosangium sp. GDMCC 1.1324]|uniref:methyltransferase n=1 Tax=Vitiosangium sp. (strain GDMCC 1.1324) TaxID=2138576 RepID=UPI000D3A49F9|nr:methyltransferase [Vitiosangium sp. GDMCC 1.1324]PTL79968.1 3-oxo-5-alpha-steroid 4-dehydrogenase [Vitiosangium sp. GDMCC 1.1324]
MNEAVLHRALTVAVLVLGGLTFVGLHFIVAPYGRHYTGGWGPTLRTRTAWILMESPAVLLFGSIFALGQHRTEWVPLALLGLWMLHYVHRTFIYPFQLKADRKRTPWLIVSLALIFNTLNAYVNARWISHLGTYSNAWLLDPRFVLGALLFLLGKWVNITSDTTLLRLRARGEGGYQIPQGGLYRLVSCPNYLGEIMEWVGWAIATWSLAGVSFALYTAANLVPRALSHHRWYRETFADYPSQRRALIPFWL